MTSAKVDIRPLKSEDFKAVVEIDEKVFSIARPDYYEAKFGFSTAADLRPRKRLISS